MIGITRFAVNPKITATDLFSQNCSSSLFLPARRVLSLCFMSQIGSSTYTGEAVQQASFPVQRSRSQTSLCWLIISFSPVTSGKPFHKGHCI
jgi:hypothetical protein